ncbi:MAG: hypothetical protein FI707_11535 [SAR202 cluster bacterium]|jgi:hypothetical protein|nr:hypothetical protein [Chloroflexota bacterium]MQG69410.1 hypothetical protein [SAR202 cluster bacterium]|tara:strand:- start:6583 stop:6975 length:393 start_codon:yes stop_codon:yes gene_type:complete
MMGPKGEDLGDVDVLAALPDSKLIVAIECKNLALARTPREIQNQLVELFKGSRDSSPTTTKHLRRVDWLRSNLSAVLTSLQLSVDEKTWTVVPLLVSDTEMYGPYLVSPPFPVCSLDTIARTSLVEIVKA